MKTCVFLANGFEEVEALTVVDFFRRAGAEIEIVSISKTKEVVGSHKIILIADKTIDDYHYDEYSCFILPGGMPGSSNLKESPTVIESIQKAMTDRKTIGAICAAPIVLVAAGVANGKHITSFPGIVLPSELYFYEEKDVVVDGNLITSRAVGTAFQFAFKLLELLGFEYRNLKEAMLIK